VADPPHHEKPYFLLKVGWTPKKIDFSNFWIEKKCKKKSGGNLIVAEAGMILGKSI